MSPIGKVPRDSSLRLRTDYIDQRLVQGIIIAGDIVWILRFGKNCKTYEATMWSVDGFIYTCRWSGMHRDLKRCEEKSILYSYES